ncbi:MAG: hypothetical protein LBJ00_01635 [Planctomycetaceae bacterium]|nr:hypothetical protein [Planctomycetaceae bacterium]
MRKFFRTKSVYAKATLKFLKLNTQAQQREAIVHYRPTGYGITWKFIALASKNKINNNNNHVQFISTYCIGSFNGTGNIYADGAESVTCGSCGGGSARSARR